MRGGTAKRLTLFHPASGQVRLEPVACSTNAIVHPWLKARLAAIVAALPPEAARLDDEQNRRVWQAWQAGLTVRALYLAGRVAGAASAADLGQP